MGDPTLKSGWAFNVTSREREVSIMKEVSLHLFLRPLAIAETNSVFLVKNKKWVFLILVLFRKRAVRSATDSRKSSACSILVAELANNFLMRASGHVKVKDRGAAFA